MGGGRSKLLVARLKTNIGRSAKDLKEESKHGLQEYLLSPK